MVKSTICILNTGFVNKYFKKNKKIVCFNGNTDQCFNGNTSSLKKKKIEGKSQKKHPTSYIQRKVLTGTLLTVFVPETAAEMLK